jgi:hypothetical protein
MSVLSWQAEVWVPRRSLFGGQFGEPAFNEVEPPRTAWGGRLRRSADEL